MGNLRNVLIETSAVCNLKCKMCPTLSYKNKFGIMKDEIFNKIISEINQVEYIGLEGWGEPLLDDKIINRVKQAKTVAKGVGFSSNATLLNKQRALQLKESGLDFLSISFDGGTKEIYENIRRGADFDKIVKNIENSNIVTSFNFVINSLNYIDIENFIKLANKLNISNVYLKPVDVISSMENFRLVLPNKKLIKTYQTAEKYIEENNLNINLNSWNIFEEKKPKDNCLANPLETIFINYLGEVSPCCNLGHPVPRFNKRMFYVKKIDNTFSSFGNIANENIYSIWNKPAYVEFRNKISKKIRPKECNYCNLF